MKEAGTLNWTTPNTGGNNNSGFAGLPGGFRYGVGTFGSVGKDGYWWSSTEFNTTKAWYRNLFYSNGVVTRGNNFKQFGFSVRCLRD
ncbi:MAG: FISUMP domain-containing protein [Chitinophagaceae bacterium]